MELALRSVEKSPTETETFKLNDIMVVIQGVLGSLETKIEMVSVEVTLVSVNLCNMSAWLKEVEDSLQA
ncbi:hypothetical protein NDU88_004927 [Pleurodeles waltl]|uniref:Uncharacterized protein n=1 Tax=Pleurodeles waltl TaxID=8319 RepID=A0AAV7LJS7_PLEWA|nr:hypothetical protein NDU88_004927 [Pleurodeles waltl]